MSKHPRIMREWEHMNEHEQHMYLLNEIGEKLSAMRITLMFIFFTLCGLLGCFLGK